MNETRDELVERYAEAVAQDPRRPSARVRDAVRAHAQMLVDAPVAAQPVTDAKPRHKAANQSYWTLSMVASLAVVGLAGLLYLQIDRGPPADREAALEVPARGGAAMPSAAAPAATRTEVAQAPAPVEPAKAGEARHDTDAKALAAASVVAPRPGAAPTSPAPTGAPQRNGQLAAAAKETANRPANAPLRGEAPMVAHEATAKASALPSVEADAAATSSYNQAADQLASAGPAHDAKREGARADVATGAALPAAPAAALAPPPPPPAAAVAAAPAVAAPPMAQLRARGVVPAATTTTRLMDAVRAGQVDAIDQLIAQGIDVNTRDDSGNTALMVAVNHRQATTVRKLLDLGADRTLPNREGYTALQLAQRLGYADIARLLQVPPR